MGIWTAVHGLADGESVTDTTLNRPLMELRERTDYLYNLLKSFSGDNPFETIRISELELETEGDTAPSIKDIVYLNPVTHKLEKAVATLAVFDNIFSASDFQALTVGVLASVNGTTGTVVLLGRTYLSDTISGVWSVGDMLEPNISFRPGPYYLSSTTPGKLTANPKGPAIYIGQFLAQVANPNLLDYAILMPQYKDVAESHIHRTIPIVTQPAGTQTYTANPIHGTHTVYGFTPVSADDADDGEHTGGDGEAVLVDSGAAFGINNLIGLTLYNVTKDTFSTITANTATTITTTAGLDWDTADKYKISIRNRVVIDGEWNSINPVQYTLTLAGLDKTNPPVTGANGFEAVYLHWESSDPVEGAGSILVKSYETALSIGTKGIKVILENVLADACDVVEASTANRRSWVINVPEQVRGWVANKQRGYFTSHFTGTNQKYSLIVLGGPHTASDNRLLDTITVKPARMYRLIYDTTLPTDGDTVTIGSHVFEFDDNDTLASADNIPVRIFSGDIPATYNDLINVINENQLTGVTAIINLDDTHVVFGVSDATTVAVSITGSPTFAEIVIPGPWSIGATNGFMIYDKNYHSLVATTSFAQNMAYWTPVALKNGLSIMFRPWDTDSTASIGDVVTNGDSWIRELIDEAPGAHFKYNPAMHQELAIVHPPIPFDCGALVLNGVELENPAVHSDTAVYRFGNAGIYWYTNRYPRVPWPQDWQSTTLSGSPEYRQYMTYHNVRMSIGDSSVVTSLRAAPDSPIKIVRCGTNDPATVGDLAIDLDLQLATVDTALEGYNVFKEIVGNKLVRGPVVSQIEAGPGIEISSPPGVPQGRGRVRVGLASGIGVSGDFERVALQNAKQEMIGMYPYIKLLGWETNKQNINTGFTAKFSIPTTMIVNSKVLVYLTLFGEEDIATPVGITPQLKYAGLEFSYSILHDYLSPTGFNPHDNLLEDLVTPPAAMRVEVPMGKIESGAPYIYKSYDPVIIHNNPSEPHEGARRVIRTLGLPLPTLDAVQGGAVIDPLNAFVTAGSLVAISIRRTGISTPANEYTGALGFIGLKWRLI